MAKPAYRAHERLVAPARGRPALWRLAAGLGLAALTALGLSTVAQALLALLPPTAWMAEIVRDAGRGDTPLPMLLLLAGFVFVSAGVMVAARVMHKRPPWGLIGPMPLALAQFWSVLRLLLGLGAVVLVLPPYGIGAPLERNLEPAIWLALLPLSLGAVLIQTSAEEILFRGYIQQSLAARFRSPVIWMGVPSVLFALGHYLPSQAGDNAVLIALWAGLFGLLSADLTARAGTLGPAIALHLFNNIVALLVISLPGSLNGLSLFTLPFDMSDTGALRGWLAVDFAAMAVAWLAARLAIGR